MGEVYRAHDSRVGRDVAIKVSAAQFGDRFEQEVRAVAALNHPNICTLYDVGPNFLVMELIEGPTLADRIQEGPIPFDQALKIARQVAVALEAAHEKHVVHRDLKPANIKIKPGGLVKVLDFGLAKVGPRVVTTNDSPTISMGRTQAGEIIGTPAYMSPEQARGIEVDTRTDVWAFGCVLFEMLTGRRPFGGDTVTETLAAILERKPLWDALPARTPPSVRRLLQRCLEKDAARRFRNVADVRAELDEVLARPIRWLTWRRAIATIAAPAALAAFVFARESWFNLRPSSTARPPIRSVAVLPLADLSARSDEDYFTNGMTDELIAALSKIRAWRVISRTSVMPYKGAVKALAVIANELGVDALVEGTIRRSNERVRITVKLVRAGREEENLWTQSYDRDLRDVLDVETEVARSIASQIRLTLTPVEEERLTARHPVDPEVLQLYLKGRAAADGGTEDTIAKGIALFEQALHKNPMYAPAHAAMALAYGNFNPSYRSPKDVMPKAREHAVRAIELDDTLSEAHTALAGVMFRYDWDWPGAEREIKHAIDLNPSSADAHELYGNYLSAVGRHPSSIAELTLAHELNPSALPTYASLLAEFVMARQYDRAIDEGRRALVGNPNFAFAYAWMGMAHTLKGQLAEAIPELKRARDLDENVTTTHFLAMAQAAAGNRTEAARLVKSLEAAAEQRYTCAYEVASVHLQLGDTEKAMQWLRRGLDEKCDCMVWLKVEPWIDPLRADPRYIALIKRVGFAEN